MAHGIIKWPSKAASEITVECTLTKDMKDCRKLAKTWKKHMADVINKLLEILHVETISLLQEAWQMVFDEIRKLNNPNSNKVRFVKDKRSCNIAIVGYPNHVGEVKKDVELIKSRVVNEIERKKNQLIEIVKLKHYEVLLLIKDHFKETTESTFPNIKVTIDENDETLILDGLYSDVKQAKTSVSEKCQQICHASAGKFSKNRQEFLSRNEVSERILEELNNKKIMSCFNIKNDELICYAFTDDQAVEAAHLIKKNIVESPIDVEPDSVDLLTSDKWIKEVNSLKSSKTFGGFLHIITLVDLRKIIIVTLNEHLGLARELIENFFSNNSILSDMMEIPSGFLKVLDHYSKEIIKEICEDLKEQQVQITKTGNKININGTKTGIDQVKMRIEDMLKNIHRKKHKIDRPGIAKYLKKLTEKIAFVEKNHKCFIQIDEEGPTQLTDCLASASDSIGRNRPFIINETEYETKAGVIIKVFVGDMTTLPVDVIVNASNQDLHHQGGLAGAIVSRGGEYIQQEYLDYIGRNGKLNEGDTFCSKAGCLPCKMIVHVCGPVWAGGNNQESSSLTDCVVSALEQAESRGYNSIAIPGLCTGIFGYPINQATSVIVKAVKSHISYERGSSIEEIILCDVREDTIKYFNEAVKQEFKGKLKNGDDHKPADLQASKDRRIQSQVAEFTVGGVCVRLLKDRIANAEVDVIVNTTAKDLRLNQGGVSASIVKMGGIDIQQECKSKYPRGIEFGEIAVTGGGNLYCRFLFHGALPGWDKNSEDNSRKVLQKFMQNCLSEAQKRSMSSIAFPALGTGLLNYPIDRVAEEMCNAIVNFSKDNPNTSLENVAFVIHEKDTAIIQFGSISGEKGRELHHSKEEIN
ncbi:protein mono-ADP-ribosyltransferase PARP14-like [Saccostrea cucullata]|uniref:protein mono-ADP-ribosyltransferase PARP14-like n=1 Tax=Saccostrea cuccullata TaxID=36930 RepID=UPI002ED37C60